MLISPGFFSTEANLSNIHMYRDLHVADVMSELKVFGRIIQNLFSLLSHTYFFVLCKFETSEKEALF